MTTKKIKDLVKISYNNSILDYDKAHDIAVSLTRFDLKQYIRELKNYENKTNVTIITPFNLKNDKVFEELFPDKKIVYKNDPSLMLGIKIKNNDALYEFNLKNTVQNLISYILESYD